MKLLPILFLWPILLLGAASIHESSGTGPVGDFIVSNLNEHGGSAPVPESLPEISTSWSYKKDPQGVQIFIPGDHFLEVVDLLVEVLGPPSEELGSRELTKSKAEEFGWFSVRDKGVGVQYLLEERQTLINIIRPQEGEGEYWKAVLDAIHKSQLDQSTFTGREYKNEFFGFSLEIPEDWTIEDIQLAREEFAEENVPRTRLLLSLTKDKASVLCFATDLAVFQGVKNASEFLLLMKDEAASPAGRAKEFGRIRSGDLSGQNFKAIAVTPEFASAEIKQYMYATVIDEHILGFSVIYRNTEDFRNIQALLQNLRFGE